MKNDPKILSEWLEIIYTQITLERDRLNCWDMASHALSRVTLAREDKIKWVELIDKYLTEDLDLYFQCMSILLPQLPKEYQAEYIKKVHTLLSGDACPMESDGARSRLPNLLRLLPDDVVFDLSPTTSRSIHTPSPSPAVSLRSGKIS